MRIAILGRNGTLLTAANSLVDNGHEVLLVGTCRAEAHHSADERAYEEFAKSVGADFFVDANINKPSRVAQLRAAQCDVSVSANWLSIVQRPACEAFTHGILNLHAGDLPRYRGNACPNWAILNSETHIGFTIHSMDPGSLDSGPILLRDKYQLTSASYIGDIHAWIEERVPSMVVEAVRSIEDGTAIFEQQSKNQSEWLRCYPRRPEDSRVDWGDSSKAIYRLVRASSRPFSGGFCTLEGERRVTIWRAELAEHKGDFLAVPGQVLSRVEGDPMIACGEGLLRLTEVTVEGYESSEEGKKAISKSLRNRLV